MVRVHSSTYNSDRSSRHFPIGCSMSTRLSHHKQTTYLRSPESVPGQRTTLKRTVAPFSALLPTRMRRTRSSSIFMVSVLGASTKFGRNRSGSAPGAEVDKVGLDISAQYTRIYPDSCRSCVFLMYSVHAPTIIMCLNNSLRSGYNVIRVAILCLSLSNSRNRLCATTTVWGSPCDAAGEQDANVGYQICDRGWTFATTREMCLAHLSRMPGPRR